MNVPNKSKRLIIWNGGVVNKSAFSFQVMGRIHAILSDGTVVTDVEVEH